MRKEHDISEICQFKNGRIQEIWYVTVFWNFFAVTVSNIILYSYIGIFYQFDFLFTLIFLTIIVLENLLYTLFFYVFWKKEKYIRLFYPFLVFLIVAVKTGAAFWGFGWDIMLLEYVLFAIFLFLTSFYFFLPSVYCTRKKHYLIIGGVVLDTIFFLGLFIIQKLVDCQFTIVGYSGCSVFLVLAVLFTLIKLVSLTYIVMRTSDDIAVFAQRMAQISTTSYDERILAGDIFAQKFYKHSIKTVIFGDIRGFTSFTNEHRNEDVVQILDGFYRITEDMCKKYGAFKPEFIADEFITHFKEGQELEALKLVKELKLLLTTFLSEYGLGVGFGIVRGELLEGLFGSLQTKKYTVIGSNVNLASRLQHAAGKNEVLVNDNFAEYLGEKFEAQPVSLNLKGIKDQEDFFKVGF